MPILSNLLCEAKGNRLTITATDLELGIRTGCEAKVKKEGSGTIRNTVPGAGRQRWDEGRLAQLEGKMGQQALEIDFLKGRLQRIDEQRKLQAVTGKPLCLPADPDPKGRSRSLDRETHVRFGGGEPGGFLSLSAPLAGAGLSGHGAARHHPADCGGVSQLPLAADDRGTETARLGGESQAGVSQRRRRRLWRGQRVWSDGAAPNAGETGALSGGAGQSAALPRWRRAGGNGAAASRDGSSSSSPYSP
jgi:hypothetical protein